MERCVPASLQKACKSTDGDEPGFKFDRHRFVPGEYVSLKEHDGTMRTFRVVAVWDLDQ